MKINEHCRITLNFAIRLQNGDVIDSNMGAAAATFSYGDGSLLPGFERKLLGLAAGEHAVFEISAEEGFGQWDENKLQTFDIKAFRDYDLQPGLVLSFADAANTERPGVVESVAEDKVSIDFNHPLASKDLQFEVLIREVTDGL